MKKIKRNREGLEYLTEQQIDDLEREIDELYEWNEREREKLEEELRRQGKWIEYGLDANQHHYAGIIKEFQERFRQIQKKYGITPRQD